MKILFSVIAAAAVAAGLYIASVYNYLLFHSIAEFFSVAIACAVFMVAWNCRHYLSNHYFLFIGIAYLFVGAVDLVHTFAYKGMNIFAQYGTNEATQLWIAARYLEGITLLLAPCMIRRRIHPGVTAGGYGFITVLLLCSILYWGIFPDCYVERAGGLTFFKRISEYIIALIFFASGAVIFYLREHFDTKVLRLLLFSIFFTVVSELSFTLYADVYGFYNLMGHFFKILSFFCIYKAIVETGLAKPYDLLFRELSKQREWLDVTLGSIGDAVVATDLFGHINYMNSVASILTKWDYRAASGHAFEDIIRIIDGKTGMPADTIIKQVLAGKTIITPESEKCIATRHGDMIPIEDNAAPILDTEGGLRGVVYVFRDVTEKRRDRIRLQKSESQFKLFTETAGRLLAAKNPQEIVDDLCMKVMAHLDCQAFFNYFVDEKSQRLHLNACAGVPEEEVPDLEWLDLGAAVCGCVARDGKRIIAEKIDTTTDARTGLVKSYGIKAYACHPLIVQAKVIGTLSFGTKTRNSFSAGDLAVMKTIADQVATAMERIRLISDLEESRNELEARVQDRTAELKRRADQLARLASELTLAEERERSRLSAILHDELQQWLVAAKVHAEVVMNSGVGEYKKNLDHVLDNIQQSIKISRSLTAELSPQVLKTGSLSQALQWLGKWMSEMHGLAVELTMDYSLEPKQKNNKLLLFQSVRELLFNAAKHAGVNAVKVRMDKDETGCIRIVVSDRGKGFDSVSIWKRPNHEGFGLLSIRERMVLMGGKFEIQSEPGKGSVFSLIIPRENE